MGSFLKNIQRVLSDQHFWQHVRHSSEIAKHQSEEHRRHVELMKRDVAGKEKEAEPPSAVPKEEKQERIKALVRRYTILRSRLEKKISKHRKQDGEKKKLEKAEKELDSAEQELVSAAAHEKKKALLLSHLSAAIKKGELVLKKETAAGKKEEKKAA